MATVAGLPGTSNVTAPVESVDLDGKHQAVMMLVVKRGVAEDVLPAERGQLADIGLDLLGRERVRAECLRSGFHDPLVGSGLLDGERAGSAHDGGWEGRRAPGRPLAAPADQFRGAWHLQRLDVVAQWRVEDAALADLQREGHRMIAAGDLGPGHGQDVNRPPLIEADVQLVVGPEITQTGGDRMARIDDVDVERPARVVGVLAVPDHAGQLAEPGPVSERPAGEVDQDQAAALLDQPFQVGPSLALARRRLLVAEMEEDHVMVEHGIGREDVGVLDDPHDTAIVLHEKTLEGRRCLFPVVGRMVHSGDKENSDRGWRLVLILGLAAH
jgi:hypothetical protein